jgi:hypothetical protein
MERRREGEKGEAGTGRLSNQIFALRNRGTEKIGTG